MGNIIPNRKIGGKQGFSLKFIPGNAECRQSGEEHTAGGAAGSQDDAVKKISPEVVFFKDFHITVRGKRLGPAKGIVQDICLCFKGV